MLQKVKIVSKKIFISMSPYIFRAVDFFKKTDKNTYIKISHIILWIVLIICLIGNIVLFKKHSSFLNQYTLPETPDYVQWETYLITNDQINDIFKKIPISRAKHGVVIPFDGKVLFAVPQLPLSISSTKAFFEIKNTE